MLSEFIRLTGIPSPGKARLANALQAAGLSVAPQGSLSVHAETDLEALLEPGLVRDARRAAAAADLVIAVDWEPTAESVRRVIDLVASREAPIDEHEVA